MIKWIRNWWWARQRNIDLNVLWPECKRVAGDLEHARGVFACHAFHDPCWIDYYGEDRLKMFIDQLS